MKSTCCSRISPRCLGTVETPAQSYDQHNRILIPLGWHILSDTDYIYGYMCHECVKAHGPSGKRVALSTTVESLLNLEDEHIASLHRSWDKSDCSEAGLVRILLIQVLEDHARKNGEHADVDQVELLRKIL